MKLNLYVPGKKMKKKMSLCCCPNTHFFLEAAQI